ncbi:MAG: tetratricopeptide repeat protein [Azoarcus sp.]|jgi:tetratricopeptide (TPR) repeat protein|nr:tetratricopeptide repeat protein [Azoarcus sp.]
MMKLTRMSLFSLLCAFLVFGVLLGCKTTDVVTQDSLQLQANKDEEGGEAVAISLIDKGAALVEQEKFEEAIAVFDDIVRRFGSVYSARERRWGAMAFTNKGVTLLRQGKIEEAIAVFDDADRRFSSDNAPEVRGCGAQALYYKGNTLAEQGKTGEAIAVFDDIQSHYYHICTPDVQKRLATAQFYKGVILEEQGRTGEAIAVYDSMYSWYGYVSSGESCNADSPELHEWTANALLNKGVALGKQGKTKEAIDTYDDIERHFGNDNSPDVQKWVAEARRNKTDLSH